MSRAYPYLMSTFRTPVGPQPNKVYWRRRLIVGLGLLAVIVIIILIVSKPGSGTPSPAGTAATSSSSTKSATPTAASTNDAKACDPKKVAVEAVTDASSYEAGINPVLSFTLKSSATTPCTFQAGSDVQEYRVTSGEELIWDSKDCQTTPTAAAVVLQPLIPKQGPSLTWDRTRSAADTCAAARTPVTAAGASYHLVIKVDGITSNDKQFILN